MDKTLVISLVMVLLFFVIPGVLCGILIPVSIRNARHNSFVLEHSKTLRELKAINNSVKFLSIPRYDLVEEYDNEPFYNDISCEDYLICRLIPIQDKVEDAIDRTLDNRSRFKNYKERIKTISPFCSYDVDIGKLNKNKLKKIEEKLFKEMLLCPTTDFGISVRIRRTNINGVYQESKRDYFDIPDLWNLFERINNKRGNRYLDEGIWRSICRVERGKVSNKLRFFIYERDHYRCCICGRRGNGSNLEIDHIKPIAKGGKTTISNLQTLCRECNKRKGSDYYE